MYNYLKWLMQFGVTYVVDPDDEGGKAPDRGDNFEPDEEDEDEEATSAKAAKDAEDAEAAKAAEEEEKKALGKDDEKDEDEKDEEEKKDDEKDGDKKDDEKDEDDEKKVVTIPKARFDQARTDAKERERALLAQIDALTKQSAVEAATVTTAKVSEEIAELETRLNKELADGEVEKATKTMSEIRTKERNLTLAEAANMSQAAQNRAIEQYKVDSLIGRLEADFPVINPDSETYDQAIVDEVGFLRAGFERNGLSSSEAIAKAIKYVLGAATKGADKADDEPKKGIDNKTKSTAETRKQEQVAKNVKAAADQPSDVNKAGIDSDKKGSDDKVKVGTMTDEEFAALPEKVRARLRGDEFTVTA